MIDGAEENIATIKRSATYWKHDLRAEASFITRDNINAIITCNGLARELGLLSVDIDGNDYCVWEAIDCVRLAIVVSEYNSWNWALHCWAPISWQGSHSSFADVHCHRAERQRRPQHVVCTRTRSSRCRQCDSCSSSDGPRLPDTHDLRREARTQSAGSLISAIPSPVIRPHDSLKLADEPRFAQAARSRWRTELCAHSTPRMPAPPVVRVRIPATARSS